MIRTTSQQVSRIAIVSVSLILSPTFCLHLFSDTQEERIQRDIHELVSSDSARAYTDLLQFGLLSVPALTRARLDEVPQVRSLALEALCDIVTTAARHNPEQAEIGRPALTDALRTEDSESRNKAAKALATLGWRAYPSIPVLADTFQTSQGDPNLLFSLQTIADSAADAVTEDIATNRLRLPDRDLTALVTNLGTAEAIVSRTSGAANTVGVRRDLTLLRDEQRLREVSTGWIGLLTSDRAIKLLPFAVAPMLIVGATALLVPAWGLFYFLFPKSLWHLGALLRSSNVKLPSFLTFFADATAILIGDDIFNPNRGAVRIVEQLSSEATHLIDTLAMEGEHHFRVPLPVSKDGELEPRLTPLSLRRFFDAKRTHIVIKGEGGIGKTSLAFQLARWAIDISGTPAARLSKWPMIPLFIDPQPDEPFDVSVQRSLREIVSPEDLRNIPPEVFLFQLRKQGRLMLIIDRFSELDRPTQEIIRSAISEYSAVVITARRLEDLQPNIILEPRHIGNEPELVVFMQALLEREGKDDLFEGELYDHCKRLMSLRGTKGITVLLAQLYKHYMIGLKEGVDDPVQQPRDIFDLILIYISRLNRNLIRKATAGELPLDGELHADSKLLAWQSIERGIRSSPIRAKDALPNRDRDSANARLLYLEQLGILKTISPSKDSYRFTLDPIAERLAALHLIEVTASDVHRWNQFLSRLTHPGCLPSEDFIDALTECCIAKEADYRIPPFVRTRLEALKKGAAAAT